MNNPSISVKPEPPQAQANWSYQDYFLKQRQRQQQPGGETPPTSMQKSNNHESTVDKEHYQQVIAKMEELAASIDVYLTITPSTLAVAASAY